jgi:CHAD domain-containing protein
LSYRIEQPRGIGDEVRRIAGEQVRKAVDDLGEEDPHEAVHEFRKRCKKVRALLRLVRPALGETYSAENRRFRDTARTFSDLRDATSVIESAEALGDRYGDDLPVGSLERLRQDLGSRRDRVAERRALRKRMAVAREAMEAAGDRIPSWELDADRFDAVAGGIARTYRRARAAMAAARERPSTPTFHEWRKRVKYHRYHLRLLRASWSPVLDEVRGQLHTLSDLLGLDHDLSVLRDVLDERSSSVGRTEVFPLIDARRGELRAQAFPLGERLFVDRPSGRVRWLRTCWESWEAERALDAALDGAAAIG